MDSEWSVFELEEQFEEKDKKYWRFIISSMHREYRDKGKKMWWNYYHNTIRIGIYETDETGFTVELEDPEQDKMCRHRFNRITNPDNDEVPPDIAEELNWIKFNACLTAQLMNYRTPPSRLQPSSIAYFIHLFMNSIGHTYIDEAQIYAWLTHRMLQEQIKQWNTPKHEEANI